MEPTTNHKGEQMPNQEQYNNVCRARFDEGRERFDEILIKIEQLHNKLFLDNGSECLQSKINRHDGWIKRVCVALGFVATVLIGVILCVLRIYLMKNI